jgi:PIN domain nuclease of toxin-antitoxin system
MPATVLDASALLAYLNREAGADLVAELLEGGATISAVNLAEVLSTASDRGVDAEHLRALLYEAGLLDAAVSVEPFTEDDATAVGALRPATRGTGLSLGDRACLALARRLDAAAVTADSAWSELDVDVEIRLIR